jgi:hypothetical protein
MWHVAVLVLPHTCMHACILYSHQSQYLPLWEARAAERTDASTRNFSSFAGLAIQCEDVKAPDPKWLHFFMCDLRRVL